MPPPNMAPWLYGLGAMPPAFWQMAAQNWQIPGVRNNPGDLPVWGMVPPAVNPGEQRNPPGVGHHNGK